MSQLLEKALATLRLKRAEFEQQYGITLVGVVGSVARGEDTTESDVDVVYDIAGRPTLFTLSRAQFELEVLLGRDVDLVDPKAMRPYWRDFIEKDLVVA
ncbi:MAG: nucleotidyltransferase family protein [Parvularculaceae bacterium]